MTDRIGNTTDHLSAEKPRRPGEAGSPRTTAAGTAPETGSPRTTAAGTAPEKTSATTARSTSEGERDRKPRDVDTHGTAVAPAPRKTPDVPQPAQAGTSLVPQDHQDELSRRMRHAVTDFVENPRRAVEEAESTFDEIIAGLTDALAERKRVLRASWREQDTEAQTEELRVALQHYRDISEHLLKI